MEQLQRAVQPGAEVALVHVDVDLGRLLQAQLLQREEAVGAGTQRLVAAGRELRDGERTAIGRRARRGRGRHGARRTRIGRQRRQAALLLFLAGQGDQEAPPSLALQPVQLQHRAGLLVLAAVPGAPQHVDARRVQRLRQRRALGVAQLLARGQAELRALGVGERAGRLRRGGQAVGIGARQHHGGKRPRQQLVQRGNDHLRRGRVRRHEAGGFQHLVHPGGEFGQAQGARRGRGRFQFDSCRRQQIQGLQHFLPCQIRLKTLPQPAGTQQPGQRLQPGGDGTRRLQRGAFGVDGGHQCGQARGGLIVSRHGGQALRVGPAAQAVAAQAALEQRHIGGGPGHGAGALLEPVEHGVAAGFARAGAQRRHQLRGGVGGGELPAGFIAHRHIRAQQRADAAREQPVAGHQRHRRAPGLNVAQHAGGGAAGLVVTALGPVPEHLAGRRAHAQIDGQRLLGTEMLQQMAGQRLGLQALEQHQGVGALAHTVGKQHVGGVVAVRGPGDGDARHRGLQRQPALRLGGQRAARQVAPVGPQRLRHAGRHRRQLRGAVDQRAGQQRVLGAQAGAFQQRAGGEQVAPALQRQVARPRREAAHLAGPVARGLEARREAAGIQARPLRGGLGHQLGKGHQHDGAGGVRAAVRHVRRHAGQHLAPGVAGGMIGLRRGFGLGICYRRHSKPRSPGSRCGDGVSVTMTPTLAVPARVRRHGSQPPISRTVSKE